MSDENARVHLIWAATLLAIVTVIAVTISVYNTEVNVTAMKNGYEQTSIPGQSGVYWIKKKEAERPEGTLP